MAVPTSAPFDSLPLADTTENAKNNVTKTKIKLVANPK
jgi:hypothetical protein